MSRFSGFKRFDKNRLENTFDFAKIDFNFGRDLSVEFEFEIAEPQLCFREALNLRQSTAERTFAASTHFTRLICSTPEKSVI